MVGSFVPRVPTFVYRLIVSRLSANCELNRRSADDALEGPRLKTRDGARFVRAHGRHHVERVLGDASDEEISGRCRLQQRGAADRREGWVRRMRLQSGTE
jgi:hypothetical protein